MSTYISLTEAKAQLNVTISDDDDKIQGMIGAAIDWAENYTNRSLGELLELNSPPDSDAKPIPDPTWPDGRPSDAHVWDRDLTCWVDTTEWGQADYRSWWARFPSDQRNDSLPLRRDVKQAILLYVETLYDRNPENFTLFETRAQNMLWPYRRALGV